MTTKENIEKQKHCDMCFSRARYYFPDYNVWCCGVHIHGMLQERLDLKNREFVKIKVLKRL